MLLGLPKNHEHETHEQNLPHVQGSSSLLKAFACSKHALKTMVEKERKQGGQMVKFFWEKKSQLNLAALPWTKCEKALGVKYKRQYISSLEC